ncbi:MAG TPA: hypothetical protein VFH64_09600 [Amnibacterium sp.]|jgi:hypothetical protein|nr:hypothetical protein [Amnibacterium sp.]
MRLEDTLQQQDPLDAGESARLFAVGGACLALIAAVAMTAVSAQEVANWPLEITAIVVVALTGAVATVTASPFRSPFRMRSHVIVLGLSLLAFLLDELAQLGTNGLVHDDWGLVTVPIFLFVVSIMRPPQEVLVGGLVAALVVGVTAVAVSPFITIQVSPFTRASIAMTSVVAPACAAAAFARAALARLRRSAVARAGINTVDEVVRLTVQQETIARLEAEVVPLISDILAGDVLTDVDGRRARALATGLRTALLADLRRDWLSEAGFVVTDRQSYVERMSPDQRTAVRGLLGALPLLDPARPGTAVVVGQDREAVLELTVPVRSRPPRSVLAPLLPVLRSVFAHVDLRSDEHAVVLVAEVPVDR